MTDDHDHEAEDRPEYDPSNPEAPEFQPPLRSTAPQGAYTMGQVATGFVVLLIGLALTFGLAVAMA
ncbi:hypothetical protein ACKVMT_05880 [Halobacteriales archaeon Cl-PHB]